MKVRDSGMPDENLWNTFFDTKKILEALEIDNNVNRLLDIGFGYGTFLLPISRVVKSVIGLDIEPSMIEICNQKIKAENISNIKLLQGDISDNQTADLLLYETIDYVTLFNILHCETPNEFLKNIYNILKRGGKVGVIHWKYENTPRGPSLQIRPKPEEIIRWATDTGFKLLKQVDLPPYHFGILFEK